VNARFKGDYAAEFAWFSISNGLPLLSMSAERAAAKMVAACKRGKSALTLTLAARLAVIANAVAPSLFGEAMKIANRFLPQSLNASGNEPKTGWQSRDRAPALFTRHLEQATARNNERHPPAL